MALSNVWTPARDSRGLFTPKRLLKSLRGGTMNVAALPESCWYPLPGSGVYISAVDFIGTGGTYGGLATAQHTPYGIGLNATGNYQTSRPGIDTPGGFSVSGQTLVALFYLYDNTKITTGIPAIWGTSWSTDTPYSFGFYSTHIGWDNRTGTQEIVVAPNTQFGGVPVSIAGVEAGLHCVVVNVYGGSGGPVRVFLDGVLRATTTGPSSWNGSDAVPGPSYYWGNPTKSGQNVFTTLFNAIIYTKQFTDTELATLSTEPLQYFFKQPDRVSISAPNRIYYKFDSPALIANTPTPTFVGTGRKAVARTTQPQSLATVDRTNKFGQNCTFLWSAANPQHDASGNWIGASSGYSFVTNSKTYTQIAANTYGTTSGKALNYSGAAADSVIFKAKRFGYNSANNLRTQGQPFTVSYLMRYIGPRFNQQTDQIAFGDSLDTSGRWIFGNTNGAGNVYPYMVAPLSYTVGGGFTGVAGEYTIGKFYLITWVFRTDGTDCYINGILNSTTTNIHNYNGNVDNIAVRTGTENLITAFALNRALNATEVAELSQNPWQLFQPKSQPLYAANLPEPVQKAPVIRTTPAANLTDFSQVNSAAPIARDLHNIVVNGRRSEAYIVTSISANNSQIVDYVPDNPLAWPPNQIIFDSKYGRVRHLPYSTTSAILNIDTFKSFNDAKGATLLLVMKFSSTTNIMSPSQLLWTGTNYNIGIGIEHQSTGTEQQLRIHRFFNNYSAWATIPTDKTLCIVLTTQPGVGDKIFVDGKLLVSQTALTGNIGNYFNNQTKIGKTLPGVYNSSNSPRSVDYFTAVWGRPLSEPEIREIGNNPLQVLRPQKHIQYLTTETAQPQPLIGGRHLKTRTTQPQATSTVNGSNYLARNITFLWSGSDITADHSQTFIRSGGLNTDSLRTKGSEKGRVMFATGTGFIRADFATKSVSDYTLGGAGGTYNIGVRYGGAPFTYGVVFKIKSLSSGDPEVFNCTNAGSTNYRILINTDGTIETRNFGFANMISDAAYSVGTWISLVVVVKNTDTHFYINGVRQSTTVSGTLYVAGLNKIIIGVGPADVLTCFTTRNVWTQQEVSSWTNNPWQLFQPEQRNFYTTLPSGLIVPRNRFLFFFN